MASAGTILTAVQSYADKVENEYPGDRYQWFSDMLRPERDIPSRKKPISTVRVVDDMGTTSRSEFFDAPKGTKVCRNFVDVLSRRQPDTSIRLVIVHFTRVHNLNFSYIDSIRSTLDINPLLFIMHFKRSHAKNDYQFQPRAPSMPHLESRYLQFSYDTQGHITLTRLTSKLSRNSIGSYLTPSYVVGALAHFCFSSCHVTRNRY